MKLKYYSLEKMILTDSLTAFVRAMLINGEVSERRFVVPSTFCFEGILSLI